MNIQTLKDYFAIYNAQIVNLGAEPEIDLSGGLGEMMQSIETSGRKWYQGPEGYWNQRAQEARQRFCKEAALYFAETGEILDFNAADVVNSATQRNLVNVTWSFYGFAKKLEKMRKSARINPPRTS